MNGIWAWWPQPICVGTGSQQAGGSVQPGTDPPAGTHHHHTALSSGSKIQYDWGQHFKKPRPGACQPRPGCHLRENVDVTQTKIMRYVGLTGLPGSGKGAFVDLLSQLLGEINIQTEYYSLSDELREEARQRGLPVTRPVLRQIANELRAADGSGVLAMRVVRKAQEGVVDDPAGAPVVIFIDAIRNPEEVRTLQQALGEQFTLVAVEAPIDLLVARIAARARADEAAEVMQQQEAARQMILGESGRGEPAHGHNISQCIALADCHIDNSGDLADLQAQARLFIADYVTAAA